MMKIMGPGYPAPLSNGREAVTLLILWCSMSKTQSFIVLVVISVFCSGDLTLTKGQRRTFKEVTVSRDLNKSWRVWLGEVGGAGE